MQNKLLEDLLNRLSKVLEAALELEQKHTADSKAVAPAFTESARNLLHYLALRHTDIRPLQQQLALLGLSSLGRTESHVLPSLQAVQLQLKHMLKCEDLDPLLELGEVFNNLSALLPAHTEALLGPLSPGQNCRIMVTLGADMARDPKRMSELMKAGMNSVRINCAHDDAQTWQQLIETVQQATQATGLACRIFMDLAGPKLRTGPLATRQELLHIKPALNESGQIAAPARVWLVPEGITPPGPADAVLPMPADWLAQLEHGQKIRFTDTRGRKRKLTVQDRINNCVLARIIKSAYIAPGTQMVVRGPEHKNQFKASVGALPAAEIPLRLFRGDTLILHSDDSPGEQTQLDDQGRVLEPAHVACSLPQVLADVRIGHRVLLNDGKIEGQVTIADPGKLTIRITYAKDKGSKLRGGKGINFPDSDLRLKGLTEKDRQDLAFVIRHADVVNMSFVNTPADVQDLFGELDRLGAKKIGVLLKIETQRAFRNLPQLFLTAMQRYPAGIMIARGDLAVEAGWYRLAEVQEEMLWLCEAAHLPVVWATQVLETLAQKGIPSRAEITDAAMSQRAECVMLNKGPHILEAVSALTNIMERMHGHQLKKTAMLRNLHIADIG